MAATTPGYNRRAALPPAGGDLAGRRIELHLPPKVSSPGVARERVAEACSAWGVDGLSDDAQLVITELVANAVRHAGTELDVTVAMRGPYLMINVSDGGRPVPLGRGKTRPTGRLDLGGRGLRLVHAIATGWGTTAGAHGKTVWATLRVHSAN